MNIMAYQNNTGTLARKGFTATISGAAVQSMIMNTLKSERRAASFTSTLISAVNASWQLQQCEPASIISAALRGEGMNLSLALGHYSIIPYGQKANYQLSYKGWAQLAMRTGLYKKLGAYDVRAGEYKGRDPITRDPVIEWNGNDVEREKLPVIGYYAFYILSNGFLKTIYWDYNKIIDHANRYSKAFDKDTYVNLLAGNLKPEEAEKLRKGSPWYDDPTSEGHMKMCKKTVLIQLLNDGTAPLSVELQTALSDNTAAEKGTPIIYDSTVGISKVIKPSESGDVTEINSNSNAAGDDKPKRGRKAAASPDSAEFNGEENVADLETGEILSVGENGQIKMQ